MIEMRWLVPSGTYTPDHTTRKLQYRYQLPRHPGFVLSHDPSTGKPLNAVEWSEWKTVPETSE